MTLKSLMLLALLFFGQQSKTETGIITGTVVPPDKTALRQPITVVLLTGTYSEAWYQQAQERGDSYWEQYKPMFGQKKELYFEVQERAYEEALQYVLLRMQRDLGAGVSRFRTTTNANGKFEFTNVTPGYYKVVAVGVAGTQRMFWQESLDVTAVPQFLQLKKHVP